MSRRVRCSVELRCWCQSRHAAGRGRATSRRCPAPRPRRSAPGPSGRGPARPAGPGRRARPAAPVAGPRTPSTYLAAHHAQIRVRRGNPKAIGATRHDILVAFYFIVRDRVPFHEHGPDWHTKERWVLLYIARVADRPHADAGRDPGRPEKGLRRGSPISPLLANLFMHYAFDAWMTRTFPGFPFERYADDIVPTATPRTRPSASGLDR